VQVVVIGDDRRSPTVRSRFCEEFLHLPGFTRRPEEVLAVLRGLAAGRSQRPVLFPTSDPDLLLISRLRSELEPSFTHFLARPELVAAFSDKRRFRDFALEHCFPVPATFAPLDAADVGRIASKLRFPVVLKPSHPGAWTDPHVQRAVDFRKALVVETLPGLLAAYDRIARYTDDLLVQEWIPGPDDAHYSLHVYMDRDSQPLACFTGRKVRVYPAYAGSGCFVRSVRVEPMIEIGLDILQRVRYTGVAVINFKRDARTGEFLVHEINPRVSQWNILPTRCGVDIPWIAYADAAGLAPEPAPRQSERLRYVHLRNDLKAFAAYRRRGEWSPARYVGSLLGGPRVHQLLAFDDPLPLLASYWDGLQARLRAGLGRGADPSPVPPKIVVLPPAPALEAADEPAVADVGAGPNPTRLAAAGRAERLDPIGEKAGATRGSEG
jgi:predicted ATP-grasp superfamily ATP-dependent carboligase